MNDIILSVFLGPLFLALFFLFSLVTVAGTKILLLHFKRESPKKVTAKRRSPRIKTPPEKTAAPTAVRTIEIDPDTVDRIYVKKPS
ncbi:MAG: hypothetical protein IJQ66_04325 [Clostridia bacterium]|nr:hypothetical protein [Clostridia bacterium]